MNMNKNDSVPNMMRIGQKDMGGYMGGINGKGYKHWNNAFQSVTTRTKPGFNGYTLKTNQDSFVADKSFLDSQSNAFFACFDGHGQQGHKVSQFLKRTIVQNIYHAIRSNQNRTEFPLDNDVNIIKMLTDAFHSSNTDLNQRQGAMTYLS